MTPTIVISILKEIFPLYAKIEQLDYRKDKIIVSIDDQNFVIQLKPTILVYEKIKSDMTLCKISYTQTYFALLLEIILKERLENLKVKTLRQSLLFVYNKFINNVKDIKNAEDILQTMKVAETTLNLTLQEGFIISPNKEKIHEISKTTASLEAR